MKILFLTPWYPHRYDAMAGLFVRKHAQAVARQGIDVGVMCRIVTDEIEQDEIVEEEVEGVREIILYTKKSGFVAELLGLKKLWQYWSKRYDVPDVVHLNVLTKQGLLAWWLLKRYNIPYVITEHWTGYLSENGDYKGVLRKKLSAFIIKSASVVMPVSDLLLNAMQRCGLCHENWQVVSNVVDDFFYKNARSQVENYQSKKRFRFVHVSCFLNRAKNTLGIVEAVEQLSRQRNDFEMVMVGTGPDIFFTRCLSDNYKLESRGIIKFTGEQTPLQVKEWMDTSNCFVLFSNYETAAVVLEEAAACGLPIISTPVGIAEELHVDGVEIVPIGNIDKLVETMSVMIDNSEKYDRDKIREKAKKYSFDKIGHQLVEIYSDIIK